MLRDCKYIYFREGAFISSAVNLLNEKRLWLCVCNRLQRSLTVMIISFVLMFLLLPIVILLSRVRRISVQILCEFFLQMQRFVLSARPGCLPVGGVACYL